MLTWHVLKDFVAGLFERDENGDNRLLFLEIKVFWCFEPVEGLSGQMAARKRGTDMCCLTGAASSAVGVVLAPGQRVGPPKLAAQELPRRVGRLR